MLAGILGGGLVAVVWDFIPGASALIGSMYAGIIVSIVLTLVFTFLYPAPETEKVEFIRPFQSKNF